MHFLDIKEQEKKNMMPTYGRFEVAIVKGKGVVAQDSEGKSYIDFTSGIGVNALGFCDDQWIAAITKQASTLQHISNLYTILRRPIWLKNFVNYPVSVKCFSAIPVRKQMNALLN